MKRGRLWARRADTPGSATTQARVLACVVRHHSVDREEGFDPGAAGGAQSLAPIDVVSQRFESFGKGRRLPRLDEEARLAMEDDFRRSADPRRHDRKRGGHRLENGQRHPFCDGAVRIDIERGIETSDVGSVSDHQRDVLQIERSNSLG